MNVRWLTLLVIILMIIAAGLTLQTQTSEAVPIQTKDPGTLAKDTGCLKCHSIDKQVVGPSYHDVAQKYKNRENARADLIKSIRDGSKGKWTDLTGGAPMPPHSARLSATEIESLVDWILAR
jgi:cytochrome c